MEVVVNGEKILFKKKKMEGCTSDYYYDDQKRYFLKLVNKFKEWHILNREAFVLQILSKYPRHFPKYVMHTSTYIITEYAGEHMTSQNRPIDLNSQVDEILAILDAEQIRHNDIKSEELLVSPDNTLVLVDFGWAMINGSLSFGNITETRKRPVFRNETDRTLISAAIDKLK